MDYMTELAAIAQKHGSIFFLCIDIYGIDGIYFLIFQNYSPHFGKSLVLFGKSCYNLYT